MDRNEHLLQCLSEECVEVAKDVSKALRFGVEDRNIFNPDGPTNRQRIAAELNDLLAVVEMCVEAGILPEDWMDREAQKEKKCRVIQFMDYAQSRKALLP